MKLGARSTLGDVAAVVGDILRRRGIPAVLTGGACAHDFTGGRHSSVDVDFVLQSEVSQDALDSAMAEAGFRRHRDRYVNPRVRFYVEFPTGPLAVGHDSEIRPVLRRRGGHAYLALSATDACRDRLAAWYHWDDGASLGVATRIAVRNRVSLARIREWSEREGAIQKFETFRARLAAARRAARRSKPR